MAKGTIAKQNLTADLQKLYGNDFIGVSGGKVFIELDDGGERVQIAISMTCPKTQLARTNTTPIVSHSTTPLPAGLSFDTADDMATTPLVQPISQAELDTVQAMLKKLNL